ncbi:MAG: hypothetical protein AAGA30_16970 [Planctomycetota bacterium]
MNRSTMVAIFYGICVIGNGMIRYFSKPDGETGLWFGIVMGVISMLAGILFSLGQELLGKIAIGFSLLVVGGWFIFEAVIEDGIQSAEPRMLFIIALTIFASIFYATAKTSEPIDKI